MTTMTVSVLAPAPLHDDPHTDWCNPAECEIGVPDPDDNGADISTVHVRTYARFDAEHGELNDYPVTVRLAREQSNNEDVLRLYVGSTVILATSDLFDQLADLASTARLVTS